MVRIIHSWVHKEGGSRTLDHHEVQEYCVYFPDQGCRAWPWLFMRPNQMVAPLAEGSVQVAGHSVHRGAAAAAEAPPAGPAAAASAAGPVASAAGAGAAEHNQSRAVAGNTSNQSSSVEVGPAAAGAVVEGQPNKEAAAALARAVAAAEASILRSRQQQQQQQTAAGAAPAVAEGVAGQLHGSSNHSASEGVLSGAWGAAAKGVHVVIDVPGHGAMTGAAGEGCGGPGEGLSHEIAGTYPPHLTGSFKQWVASPKGANKASMAQPEGVASFEGAAAAVPGVDLQVNGPALPAAAGGVREKRSSNGLSECLAGSMMGSWSSQGSHHHGLGEGLHGSSRGEGRSRLSSQQQQHLEQAGPYQQQGALAGAYPRSSTANPAEYLDDASSVQGMHGQHQGGAGIWSRPGHSDLSTVVEVSARQEMPSGTLAGLLRPDAVQLAAPGVSQWKEVAHGYRESNGGGLVKDGSSGSPQPIGEGVEGSSSSSYGDSGVQAGSRPLILIGGAEGMANDGEVRSALVQGSLPPQRKQQQQEGAKQLVSFACQGRMVEMVRSAPLPGVQEGPSTPSTTGPSLGHPVEDTSSSSRSKTHSNRSSLEAGWQGHAAGGGIRKKAVPSLGVGSQGARGPVEVAGRRVSSISDPGRVEQVLQQLGVSGGSPGTGSAGALPGQRRASGSCTSGEKVLPVGRTRRLSWMSTGSRNQDVMMSSYPQYRLQTVTSRAAAPAAAAVATTGGASYFNRRSAAAAYMSWGQREGRRQYRFGDGSVRGGTVFRTNSHAASAGSVSSAAVVPGELVTGPSAPVTSPGNVASTSTGSKPKKGQELLCELGQQVGLAGGLHGSKQRRRRKSARYGIQSASMLHYSGVDREFASSACVFSRPLMAGAAGTPGGSTCPSPRAGGGGTLYCNGIAWGSTEKLSKVAAAVAAGVGGGVSAGHTAELQLVPMAGPGSSGPLTGRLGSGQTDAGLVSVLDGGGNLNRASFRSGEVGLLRIGSTPGLSVSVTSLAVGGRGCGAPVVAPFPDQEIMYSLRMGGMASSRGPRSVHGGAESTATLAAAGFEGPNIGQTCTALMAGSWLWARQLLVHDLGTFK